MTATLDRPTTLALTLSRPALRAALAKLMPVTSRSLPVLQHVLLEARDGVLTMSATNLDTFVRLTLPCEFAGAATVVLPAKLLADILASLPSAGAITLTLRGQGAEITAGRSRFEINGLSADEFPRWPDGTSRHQTTVTAAPFLDALTRCVVHTSDAESRPILNAVLVEQEAGQVAVVGTDGHSFARLPAGAGDFSTPCLIYRLAVPVLARLFAGLAEDTTLTLSSDDNRVRIDTADTSVQVRLVEGPYPNYRQLLAQTPAHVVVCDRALFAAALKRVGLASDKSGRVSIHLDDEMVLSAATTDLGNATDVVPIEEHTRETGRSMSFDVSAALLGNALATLTSDRVQFSVEAPEKALLLRKVDQLDSDPTVLLVMPLRRL